MTTNKKEMERVLMLQSMEDARIDMALTSNLSVICKVQSTLSVFNCPTSPIDQEGIEVYSKNDVLNFQKMNHTKQLPQALPADCSIGLMSNVSVTTCLATVMSSISAVFC